MNSTSPLFYSDLERHIRRAKRLTVHLAGHSLELDLSFKHERAYAAKLILNLRHPQSDLDEFLFKRFVKPGDTVLDAAQILDLRHRKCSRLGQAGLSLWNPYQNSLKDFINLTGVLSLQ
jgi:hypothetical protein